MSKQKKITWTPARQKEYKYEIVCRTVALCLATLMDEYDYTKEQLEDFSERFCRYNEAVDEHLITMNKVIDIISEQLGVNIHW